jgi:hypothetical protein
LERLSRPIAAAILLLVVAVIVFSATPSKIVAPPAPPGQITDAGLYEALVAKVRAGAPYHAAAVAQMRAGHYPLRPFVVVRPPALAMLESLSPGVAPIRMIEVLLAAAVIFVWVLRLRSQTGGPMGTAWTAFVLFTGVGAAIAGGVSIWFHEVWSGLLIALSLGLRTRGRFLISALIGLMAALVRELAMPYLLVMILLAAWEKRPREAAAFALALAASLLALAWHAWQVLPLTHPGDPASPGWLTLGGLGFVREADSWNLLASRLGVVFAAAIAPLSLIGAAAWRDDNRWRLLAVIGGYLSGFLVFGRPENAYWGFLVAPLVAVGLVLAPMGLLTLGRRTVTA